MSAHIRIGLLVITLLFIVGGASGTDSSTFGSGDISIKLLDIKEETDNKIKINYGDPLKVEVTYPQSQSGYLDIMDRDNYDDLIERFDLEYGMKKEIITLPVESYRPATNFSIRVDLENQTYVSNDKVIEAQLLSPEILIDLKNYGSEIAVGDKIIFDGSITANQYKWTLLGPYEQNSFQTLAESSYVDGSQTVDGNEALVSNPEHQIELKISTLTIFNSCGGTTGSYALKIWDPQHPDTVERLDFTIAKPEVDLIIDRESIAIGEDLQLEGKTNVAVTDSRQDDTSIGLNKVTIEVYDSMNKVDTYSVDVEENRTFQKKMTIPLSWERDAQYKLIAKVTTGADHYGEDTEYIEVTSPQVEFTMDDVTYRRNDIIDFKGTSSLGAGSLVYIKRSDLSFIEHVSSESVGGTDYVKAMVGSDGTWNTGGMRISDDAPFTSYKVTAVIFSPGTTEKLDEDSVKIRIMKNELMVDLDNTKVAKGGLINVTGNTTTDKVYVFAGDDDTFLGITEDPSGGVYKTRSEDKVIYAKEGDFQDQIKVSNIAGVGYTNLFFYASSSDCVDTDKDPQKFFLISIVESIDPTSDNSQSASNTSTTPAGNATNSTESKNHTAEQTSQNETVNHTTTPQPTATPSPEITEEEQNTQEQDNQNTDTEESAKETPTLRKREDMTVPTLQRMVPGFEFVLAVIGISVAIYLRKR
ncbi:MAG: hypothetical protein ACOCSC_00525 [Candidatus Hadarchaeota archaeon]